MSGTELVTRPKRFAEAVTAVGGTCQLPAILKYQSEKAHGIKAQEAAVSPDNAPGVDAQNAAMAPKDRGPSAEMLGLTLRAGLAFGNEVEEMQLETGERIYGEGACWTDEQTAAQAMAEAIRGRGLDAESGYTLSATHDVALGYARWMAENFVYYGWMGHAVHQDDAEPEKDQFGKEADKYVASGSGIKTMSDIASTATTVMTGAAAVGMIGGGATLLDLTLGAGGSVGMRNTIHGAKPALQGSRGAEPTERTNPHVVSAYRAAAEDQMNLSRYLNETTKELDMVTRSAVAEAGAALFQDGKIVGQIREAK